MKGRILAEAIEKCAEAISEVAAHLDLQESPDNTRGDAHLSFQVVDEKNGENGNRTVLVDVNYPAINESQQFAILVCRRK